jgi:hypothetical protein
VNGFWWLGEERGPQHGADRQKEREKERKRLNLTYIYMLITPRETSAAMRTAIKA